MQLANKCIGIGLALFLGNVLAADSINTSKDSVKQGQKATEANNSGVNKRDRTGDTLTPEDQPNNDVDRGLLANVRQAITDDKSLSTAAHNVKILVANNVVTLRGPVDSTMEKSKLKLIAAQVKGVSNVHNELEVKSK